MPTHSQVEIQATPSTEALGLPGSQLLNEKWHGEAPVEKWLPWGGAGEQERWEEWTMAGLLAFWPVAVFFFFTSVLLT